MKREILQKLHLWKAKKDRNPLILQGVRQCGKTYALETFGRESFEHVYVVDFEQAISLRKLFEGDINPATILQGLAFYFNAEINPATDLLVFDEIQACPRALTSLKYFAEQVPEQALCAAGSLLGLSLAPASFPVGKVDFMSLYPMSFREFLWALQDDKALNLLDTVVFETIIPPTVHDYLWERFKWYLVVGGLPEAVSVFVEHHKQLYSAFQRVREKQSALIKSYYADIAKHAGKVNAMHIERVFQSVPSQLAKPTNSSAPRFQFGNVVPGIDRYQGLAGAIDWLEKANLIISVPLVDHVEMPIKAYGKARLFKLYCFDIGILNAMNQLDPKTIIDYDFGGYKGYIAENYVAQQLQCVTQEALYCWQQNRAEVEFIQQYEDKIVPIEVKAGHIRQAKSLEKYLELYKPKLSVIVSAQPLRFDAQRHSLQVRCPFYLVDWLISLLALKKS